MRRALAVAAAAALVAAAFVPAYAGPEPPFHRGSAVGGGVVDLTTGEVVSPAEPPGDDPTASAATVLPYRSGARYRIPYLLNADSGAEPVVVTDVRLATGTTGVVGAAGAVWSAGCCALVRPEPFAPVTLPGPGPQGAAVMLGVDVELCCAPPPAGWVERLPGVLVTYRKHGLTRTAYLPFDPIQTVIVRA